MTAQSDRFPPGFRLACDVMTPDEEAALIELVEASGLSTTHFSEQPGNLRGTMSYIYKYDVPSQGFVPAPPIPEGLRTIAGRAAAFAGLAPEDIRHCALNGYAPGAILESHIDMPCWDRVVGVSLGTAATMTLRRVSEAGEETVPVELPPRSMYLLSGEARHQWEHGMPPVEGRRWSITFRSLTAQGMEQRCAMTDSLKYA